MLDLGNLHFARPHLLLLLYQNMFYNYYTFTCNLRIDFIRRAIHITVIEFYPELSKHKIYQCFILKLIFISSYFHLWNEEIHQFFCISSRDSSRILQFICFICSPMLQRHRVVSYCYTHGDLRFYNSTCNLP